MRAKHNKRVTVLIGEYDKPVTSIPVQNGGRQDDFHSTFKASPDRDAGTQFITGGTKLGWTVSYLGNTSWEAE